MEGGRGVKERGERGGRGKGVEGGGKIGVERERVRDRMRQRHLEKQRKQRQIAIDPARWVWHLIRTCPSTGSRGETRTEVMVEIS